MSQSVFYHPKRQTGYSSEELRAAFAAVSDARDWKGPILSVIRTTDRRLIRQAIIWYTSTVPAFGILPGHPERLVVSAAGYRCGPAGDSMPREENSYLAANPRKIDAELHLRTVVFPQRLRLVD
ncbi:MAG: hypothetical protein ABJD11_06960 [Gemmatimonadota bacterium]